MNYQNSNTNLFKELSETFGANTLAIAIGVITSIIIARILGPKMRGEYATIIMWSSIFSTFVSFGINEGVGYFIGNNKKRHLEYLQKGSIIIMFFSTTFFFPSILLIPHLMKAFSKETIYLAKYTTGITLFFIPQFMLVQSYLQGSGLIKQLNLINLLNSIIYLLLIIFVWIISPMVNNMLILATCSYIITYTILCFISITWLAKIMKKYKQKPRNFFTMNYKDGKNLFLYGFPVTLVNMINQLSTKLDQIFLSFLVEPRLIGLYAVALNTIIPLSSINNAVSTIALPRITNENEIKEKGKIVCKLYLSYFYSVLPIFLFMFFMVPYIIPLLFGIEFVAAIDASKIILLSSVFIGTNQLGISVLKAVGHPNDALICRIFSLALLIVSLNYLINMFDIIGAALAMFLSNFISSTLILIFIRKILKINVIDLMFPKKDHIEKTITKFLKVISYQGKQK